MLVKCPTCRIEFNPSSGVCPICRKYIPPKQETREFEVGEATEALRAGASPEAVRVQLLDAGYDELEIGTVFREIQGKVNNENRAIGLQRMALGLMCLAGYGLSWVMTLGYFIFPTLLLLGALLFPVGSFQLAFGNRLQ